MSSPVPTLASHKAELARRAAQSEKDKRIAETEKLKREHAKSAGLPDETPIEDVNALFEAEVEARLAQRAANADALAAARAAYPRADFDAAAAFSTPEEIERTARLSHERAEAQYKEMEAEAMRTAQERFIASQPETDPLVPTTVSHDDAPRPPSIEEIASLPFNEFVAVPRSVIQDALNNA